MQDLKSFVDLLESRGQLKRITAPVSAELEISEITDRVSKGNNNVALLFENVTGFDIPILTNQFGSMERMSLALGVEQLDDAADKLRDLLKLPYLSKDFNVMKLMQTARSVINFPKYVRNAPCQEVVEEPDLDKLPILKCWPLDGGEFITLPLVFTKNPKTGKRNCGMYRLQKYDSKTLGMHWHIHKNGAENFENQGKIECAVAIGTEPITTYAATAPLPKDVDEMVFAGFLRQKSVELVKCKTVDLHVPANAEIVLEGYVEGERTEGPFGDHTGFYSLADKYPIFHVTCMTHRKKPIYSATIVGKPPMEDCYLAKATERIFLPLLQQVQPEIVDINMPFAGVFHNCVIVSIKKRYPYQARKVMHGLWGMGQMMNVKMIVVVDEYVDVQNLSEVAWRALANVDADRDLEIVHGPLDVLDHSSPMPKFGAKIGIDATRSWKEEGFNRDWPEEIKMSAEVVARVDEIWSDLGL